MPRRKLSHCYGAIYHVMVRGNNRQNIFSDDDDRYQFLDFIQDGITRFDYILHSYCLMNNHVHLILQVKDTPLNEIMHNLNLRYARFFNKKSDKIGHCFQGRYHPLAVHTGDYLLLLIRYVHLNPVKAGIVNDPLHHPWNSHKNYINFSHETWITCDWVLQHFDSNKEAAIKKYQHFIFDTIGNDQDENLIDMIIEDQDLDLNETLIRNSNYGKIDHRTFKASFESIVEFTSKLLDINKQKLKTKASNAHYVEARAMIAWLAKELELSTIKDTAEYFGREISCISKAKNKLVNLQINELIDYKSKYLEETSRLDQDRS
jgi:putative transposase